MKPVWTRIAGDILIVGAWLLFVTVFLLYGAGGLAAWQVWGIVLVSAVIGCSVGGTWASRWKKAAPKVLA